MKKWMIPLIVGLFITAFVISMAFAQAPDIAKKAEPAKIEKAVTSAKPAAIEKPAATGVLKVEKIGCGTNVVDRELEGQDTTFAATIEKVYCWSLITGGSEGASINHVWYHDGKEVVKIPINVKYPRARVHSYKTMYAGSKGEWKVEVVDAGGQVLGSTTFKIQ
jgi:hypothetical protein